jgi:drug/metabolite transporter (DMT)-like permease
MQRYIAYINLTLAMFISGSAVVVSKNMVTSLPTFLATELGILIGMIILIPFTFLIKKCELRYDVRTHSVMFSQALCGVFLYRIFTFVGLKFTSAASGGLITSAGPVLVLLLAYFILKERITARQVVAIICTVIGILMVNLSSYASAGGHGSMKGNLLIMAAVLCEALFSILSKAECRPVSALCRTTIIVIYAFLLLLPFSVHDAINYNFGSMDVETILCVSYYGVFVTFLSYVFWFRGIALTSAGNAAVFTSVVPISSVLLSVLLLHEKLLPLHIVSLGFILAGIWVSCTSKKSVPVNIQ